MVIIDGRYRPNNIYYVDVTGMNVTIKRHKTAWKKKQKHIKKRKRNQLYTAYKRHKANIRNRMWKKNMTILLYKD